MTSARASTGTVDFVAELRRRMARTQRHRLLQGYPMVPLMKPVGPEESLAAVPFDERRPLIVGVLPHPFCNPQVQGCGFCTFPHQKFSSSAAKAVVASVVQEIATFCESRLRSRRSVDALYMGGGTANLTPPDAFERLCAELARRFALDGAEVTLEGVPIYFLTRPELLETLCGLPARHRRLSMGVQTFEPAQLARMGRSAFGTKAEIAEVVTRAHARGLTASADLLCNLPGQTVAQMRDDVRTASELGFDQLCLYHLVLVDGLPVPWARDSKVMNALPGTERAFAHWLELRALLLELRFVQTTLTNFERAEVHASPRRFVYEAKSFEPETYDGVGFGPSAISCFSAASGGSAVKWINAANADVYQRAISRHGQAPERLFSYEPADRRLLHLTRKLPLLSVPRVPYRARFGTDVVEDFPDELAALGDAGLVTVSADRLALTTRGMFYADSVAGLLAWRRAAEVQNAREEDSLEALGNPMG